MKLQKDLKDSNPLFNGRPTIALLSGSLSSKYHEEILRGVDYAAKKLNINVIAFAGGPLKSPDPLALNRGSLFDLVDLDLFDGIIIPLSSHGRFLNDNQKKEFLDRYNSLHVVNIGSEIEGLTNIVSDHSKGINEIVKHFAKVHNYKKIAFVRGPINHKTSDLRTGIYRNALIENNLKVNEDLIFYSDLNRNRIKDIAPKFINKDGSYICDAVITFNDNQALGLMESFKSLNIRVPEDIAICGSINSNEGLFSFPPLTTIYEPNYELGLRAVEAINNLIMGKLLLRKIPISTSLVIRNSCGCCSSNLIKEYNKDSSLITKKPHNIANFIDLLIHKTQEICNAIIEQNRAKINRDILEKLIYQFKDSLLNEDFNDFLKMLHIELNNTIRNENIIPWLNITNTFQLSALDFLKEFKRSDVIINFISNIITIENEIEYKAIKYQGYDTNNYISSFREIANNLNSSFDLSSVYKLILEILDTREFHLSAYDINNDSQGSVTNFMTIRDKNNIDILPEFKIFNKVKLLPSLTPKFKERYTLLVLPLSFRKKPLGYLVLELSNKKSTAYENMQAIISTALKNELQILALKNAEERFSDIAHSTSNWLWESDKDFRFTYSSESVINVIGYTPLEVIGRRIISFSLPSSYTYYERIVAREKMHNVECWYRHKNNKVVCLVISANPIFKNGEFIGYRGVFEDITEQKLQEEKIHKLAYSDILTTLPNRAMFSEQLELIIESSKRKESRFALIFLDLDRFKHINDSFGHEYGDILLKEVSNILKLCTRSHDTISRLGGDEFTIIIPDVSNDDQVLRIVQRIIRDIAKPITLKNKEVYISASLGISIFPYDGEDSSTLLNHSDNAMYQAKSLGRNRYVFYNKVLEEKNSRRILNEEILHNAISKNQFILNYQPQVNTFTGEILGIEALVRIDSPTKGIIYPNEFIPLAEQLGIIGIVDETVLIEACKQHKIWFNKGLGNIRMSLNLSAVQLRKKEIIDQYMNIINKYRVDPKYIQFEITEHTLIDNDEIALEILNGFKSKGVSIALDDFGTGYSSLSCISLYPIDTIKIDRSFVIDSVVNEKNRAIINSITHLAKSLKLKIVAEGIETKEQYELIKELKCDEIQGYYFHKPCNASELTKLLRGQNPS